MSEFLKLSVDGREHGQFIHIRKSHVVAVSKVEGSTDMWRIFTTGVDEPFVIYDDGIKITELLRTDKPEGAA